MKENTKVAEILRKAEKEIRDAINLNLMEQIFRRQDAIFKLLDNGRIILHTTYGDRFYKLYNQRQKLHSKIDAYNIVLDMLIDKDYE